MSKVAIQTCRSYEAGEVAAAVRSALDCLGGIEKFVHKGTKVLLKPNLLGPKRPEEAVTTHPALIRAVAMLVQQAGGIVTLADSPGGPYITSYLKKTYAATGAQQVADELGLTLNLDLSDVEVSNPAARMLKRVRVIKPAADADLIINLPKLKTHTQMVFTGAVKNMFGVIAGTAKIEYHMSLPAYGNFADGLIDIFLAAPPGLNIMDAVVGMEGAGPSAGDPRELGAILASEDAFALDFAALHAVVGIDPSEAPVLKAGMERSLCPRRIEEIELLGAPPASVRAKRFNIPTMDSMLAVTWSRGRFMRAFANKIKPRPIFDADVCTGCGECMRCCPAKVITLSGGKPSVNLELCIRCFCCQELCPSKAVKVKRLPPALSAILRLVFILFGVISAKIWRGGRKTRP